MLELRPGERIGTCPGRSGGRERGQEEPRACWQSLRKIKHCIYK